MIMAMSTMVFLSACKNDSSNKNETKAKVRTENSDRAGAQPSGLFNVTPNDAKINWEGSKVGTKHYGTISISDGQINITDGKIRGGEFVIDMNTIQVKDQQGEWKEKLESHLKGSAEGREDHFFNVAEFPFASFSISKVGNLEGDAKYNTMIYGNLTIKGTTKPVSFMASVQQDGEMAKIRSSEIVLNRTEWGVNYNSKSVFPNLQDNIISDDIKLNVSLAARKIRN